MSEETVEALIEGGQASAGPPIGSSLGPLGVNIGEVVDDINEKTKHFEGMEVPVTVTVDTDTKEYEVSVGTPPTSALVIEEGDIEKGAADSEREKVLNLWIEHIIKIAQMKGDDLLGKTLKQKMKEVIGTCNSMGVKVEGVEPQEAIKNLEQGEYDQRIEEEKTELTDEEQEKFEEENEELQKEREQKMQELRETAEEIIDLMEDAEREEIRSELKDENIPPKIIEEVLPAQVSADVDIPGEEGEEE